MQHSHFQFGRPRHPLSGCGTHSRFDRRPLRKDALRTKMEHPEPNSAYVSVLIFSVFAVEMAHFSLPNRVAFLGWQPYEISRPLLNTCVNKLQHNVFTKIGQIGSFMKQMSSVHLKKPRVDFPANQRSVHFSRVPPAYCEPCTQSWPA